MYMVWFDNDSKKSTREKVQAGAAHFARKFGLAPKVCRANPADFGGLTEPGPDEVRLILDLRVLRHHFWLGMDEESGRGKV